jgi:molecular chaperone GrpE
MEMTLEEFKKGMSKHGVSVVDPLHQKFDPNLHMALVEVERPDLEPGTVVHVEKKGYLLNGRVIRAATVAISKK